MNTQQRYEFIAYAKDLFAQSKWTTPQWEAFADALMGYSDEVAREAVKQHFQTTRFTTPTTGAVVNVAKELRFGEAVSGAATTKARTADDVIGEFRWTWHAAVRMYGLQRAVRQFASSDATRHVPELRRLGWSQDQIDVVIQEITGGEVADSFRDHQQRLCETWHERRGPVRAWTKGSCLPIQASLPVPLRVHPVPPRDGEVVDAGDSDASRPSDARSDSLRAQGGRSEVASTDEGQREATHLPAEEAGDDNDLPPGTYIDVGESNDDTDW